MVKYYFTLCLFLLGIFITFPAHEIIAQKTGNKPFRLAVAGITHGHVPWILGRENNSAIELVGIFETNKELVKKYALKFNLDIALFYSNLEKMLDEVKPEGLVAFGSIYEHMAAVEAAAPRRRGHWQWTSFLFNAWYSHTWLYAGSFICSPCSNTKSLQG